MLNKSNKAITWGAVLVFVVIVIGSFVYKSAQDEKSTSALAPFAQCLADKGAVFYGAFWCSHCKATKDLFGDSQKFLPYVECSTADGRAQLQVCKDKKIEGYPTWIFADSSRLSGEVALSTLSQKTGCVLSQ
jgi:thiol-disulfide isomerase/thioredoxin